MKQRKKKKLVKIISQNQAEAIKSLYTVAKPYNLLRAYLSPLENDRLLKELSPMIGNSGDTWDYPRVLSVPARHFLLGEAGERHTSLQIARSKVP